MKQFCVIYVPSRLPALLPDFDPRNLLFSIDPKGGRYFRIIHFKAVK
jgi:hypothetical protein